MGPLTTLVLGTGPFKCWSLERVYVTKCGIWAVCVCVCRVCACVRVSGVWVWVSDVCACVCRRSDVMLMCC